MAQAANGAVDDGQDGARPDFDNLVRIQESDPAADALCTRIDRVGVLESLDMSGYANE